ncbi:MAG: antitoxin [Candidatus Omnitrophica bacterium]|nr:antitoxin [Candidatus Omnitrophota bacterium]
MAKFNPEEQELLRSVERGEWRTAGKAALKRYVRAARHTLRKDCRVNIRLSQIDLKGIQTKAFEEGLPYQTLISSVLHKYVTGSLVGKP